MIVIKLIHVDLKQDDTYGNIFIFSEDVKGVEFKTDYRLCEKESIQTVHLQKLLSFHFLPSRIYSTIRQGFPFSRMTTNNKISSMKVCYITSFTLPKQSKRTRSIS